jgi:hypothetical protein
MKQLPSFLTDPVSELEAELGQINENIRAAAPTRPSKQSGQLCGVNWDTLICAVSRRGTFLNLILI